MAQDRRKNNGVGKLQPHAGGQGYCRSQSFRIERYDLRGYQHSVQGSVEFLILLLNAFNQERPDAIEEIGPILETRRAYQFGSMVFEVPGETLSALLLTNQTGIGLRDGESRERQRYRGALAEGDDLVATLMLLLRKDEFQQEVRFDVHPHVAVSWNTTRPPRSASSRPDLASQRWRRCAAPLSAPPSRTSASQAATMSSKAAPMMI